MALDTATLNGQIALIAPSGNLLGEDETNELLRAASSFIEQKCTLLVIDLQRVPYINSSGIGALVSIHTSFKRRDGRAVLCGINEKLHSIFTITNLAMVFEVYGTRDDAVRGLGQPMQL